MPNRHKRLDICTSDAMSVIDQLQSAGRNVDLDVTDGLMNFSSLDGSQPSLMIDFTNIGEVKVTSHIGNQRIEHPTLRAGVTTFIANVTEKNRKGIN